VPWDFIFDPFFNKIRLTSILMDPHTELKIAKDFFAEQGGFSLQAGSKEMYPKAQKSFREGSSL
jgi:hypothetical protein